MQGLCEVTNRLWFFSVLKDHPCLIGDLSSQLTLEDYIDFVLKNLDFRAGFGVTNLYKPCIDISKDISYMEPLVNTVYLALNMLSGRIHERIFAYTLGNERKLFLNNVSQQSSKKNDYIFFMQDSNTPVRIGKGVFGEVQQVFHIPTGEIRCAKRISRERMSRSAGRMICNEPSVLEEIKLLQRVDHPNVVRLLDYFYSEDFYIIMEYIPGSCLIDVILKRLRQKDTFTELETFQAIYGLLHAVSACHRENVVHRDIKPDNIVVPIFDSTPDYLRLKLIDFGLAVDGGDTIHLKAGTPYYMAPEVSSLNYNHKCDIWSVGVIMYMMLSGHLPIVANTSNNNNNNNNGKGNGFEYFTDQVKMFPNKQFDGVSSSAKDLMWSMLQIDPQKRASMTECLSSKWITNFEYSSGLKSQCSYSHRYANPRFFTGIHSAFDGSSSSMQPGALACFQVGLQSSCNSPSSAVNVHHNHHNSVINSNADSMSLSCLPLAATFSRCNPSANVVANHNNSMVDYQFNATTNNNNNNTFPNKMLTQPCACALSDPQKVLLAEMSLTVHAKNQIAFLGLSPTSSFLQSIHQDQVEITSNNSNMNNGAYAPSAIMSANSTHAASSNILMKNLPAHRWRSISRLAKRFEKYSHQMTTPIFAVTLTKQQQFSNNNNNSSSCSNSRNNNTTTTGNIITSSSISQGLYVSCTCHIPESHVSLQVTIPAPSNNSSHQNASNNNNNNSFVSNNNCDFNTNNVLNEDPSESYSGDSLSMVTPANNPPNNANSSSAVFKRNSRSYRRNMSIGALFVSPLSPVFESGINPNSSCANSIANNNNNNTPMRESPSKPIHRNSFRHPSGSALFSLSPTLPPSNPDSLAQQQQFACNNLHDDFFTFPSSASSISVSKSVSLSPPPPLPRHQILLPKDNASLPSYIRTPGYSPSVSMLCADSVPHPRRNGSRVLAVSGKEGLQLLQAHDLELTFCYNPSDERKTTLKVPDTTTSANSPIAASSSQPTSAINNSNANSIINPASAASSKVRTELLYKVPHFRIHPVMEFKLWQLSDNLWAPTTFALRFRAERQLINTVMAKRTIPSDTDTELALGDLFSHIDVYSKGYLSKLQIVNALMQIGSFEYDAVMIANAVDLQGNDEISFNQFLGMFAPLICASRARSCSLAVSKQKPYNIPSHAVSAANNPHSSRRGTQSSRVNDGGGGSAYAVYPEASLMQSLLRHSHPSTCPCTDCSSHHTMGPHASHFNFNPASMASSSQVRFSSGNNITIGNSPPLAPASGDLPSPSRSSGDIGAGGKRFSSLPFSALAVAGSVDSNTSQSQNVNNSSNSTMKKGSGNHLLVNMLSLPTSTPAHPSQISSTRDSDSSPLFASPVADKLLPAFIMQEAGPKTPLRYNPSPSHQPLIEQPTDAFARALPRRDYAKAVMEQEADLAAMTFREMDSEGKGYLCLNDFLHFLGAGEKLGDGLALFDAVVQFAVTMGLDVAPYDPYLSACVDDYVRRCRNCHIDNNNGMNSTSHNRNNVVYAPSACSLVDASVASLSAMHFTNTIFSRLANKSSFLPASLKTPMKPFDDPYFFFSAHSTPSATFSSSTQHGKPITSSSSIPQQALQLWNAELLQSGSPNSGSKNLQQQSNGGSSFRFGFHGNYNNNGGNFGMKGVDGLGSLVANYTGIKNVPDLPLLPPSWFTSSSLMHMKQNDLLRECINHGMKPNFAFNLRFFNDHSQSGNINSSNFTTAAASTHVLKSGHHTISLNTSTSATSLSTCPTTRRWGLTLMGFSTFQTVPIVSTAHDNTHLHQKDNNTVHHRIDRFESYTASKHGKGVSTKQFYSYNNNNNNNSNNNNSVVSNKNQTKSLMLDEPCPIFSNEDFSEDLKMLHHTQISPMVWAAFFHRFDLVDYSTITPGVLFPNKNVTLNSAKAAKNSNNNNDENCMSAFQSHSNNNANLAMDTLVSPTVDRCLPLNSSHTAGKAPPGVASPTVSARRATERFATENLMHVRQMFAPSFTRLLKVFLDLPEGLETHLGERVCTAATMDPAKYLGFGMTRAIPQC